MANIDRSCRKLRGATKAIDQVNSCGSTLNTAYIFVGIATSHQLPVLMDISNRNRHLGTDWRSMSDPTMMRQLKGYAWKFCELLAFDEMDSVKKRLKSWVGPDFVKCRLDIDFGQLSIPPRVRLVERLKG